MTDDPTELHDLASAYLDDEVSAEERARVEADPELLARVEQLRRVSEAVGREVPPLDDAEAAAQRRRALLEGQERASHGRPAPPKAVRRRPTWLPSPAAAAAVIIVIALVGVFLMIGPGGDGDNENAATSGGATIAGGAPQSTDASNEERPAASDRGESLVDLQDLGSFATRAELTRALDAVDVTTLSGGGEATAPSTSAPTGADEVDRCDQTVEAQGDLDARLAVATARLAGERVLVFSHPVAGAGGKPVTQLSVVDVDDCRVLFAVQR
jgi:putative zinc finger protein